MEFMYNKSKIFYPPKHRIVNDYSRTPLVWLSLMPFLIQLLLCVQENCFYLFYLFVEITGHDEVQPQFLSDV